MTRRRTKHRALLAAIAVAALAALAGAGNALAYGHADQPIAQVEISANCNDPGFWLCQKEGLGGVWAWAELDTAGGGSDHGTMDYTLTFCGHAGPGGGAHSAGAFGHPGGGVWYTVAGLGDAPADAFPFFDPGTYSGPLRVLDFAPGSGADDFVAVVPSAVGHYTNPSDWPARVQFQTQVAP